MRRNENDTRTDEQRQAKIRRPADENQTIGQTPEKAEGDEKTVDEALRNQQKRR